MLRCKPAGHSCGPSGPPHQAGAFADVDLPSSLANPSESNRKPAALPKSHVYALFFTPSSRFLRGLRGASSCPTGIWFSERLRFADWIATELFGAPPTLGAFRAIQESRVKLLIGIVVAWLLGGFLEGLVFRGVVLGAVESVLAPPCVALGLRRALLSSLPQLAPQSSTGTRGHVRR
jgi:hypothetical protein